MLKKIFIAFGLTIGFISAVAALMAIFHSLDVDRYNQLTQCHSRNGFLVEEVDTKQTICIQRDKVGIK